MIRLCITMVMAISILLGLVGCGDHKDILCPGDDPRVVTVRFMWDKATEADPAGMTAYFFPLGEGARIWRFDISGRDGGNVEIPIGVYRFLAVNNDLPGVVFSGQDAYDSLTAHARNRAGSETLSPTGMLYGASVEWVEVTPCGIAYTTQEGLVKECRQGLMRCYPDSLSCVYNVVFSNCKGLENMRSSIAIIDGIAPYEIVAPAIPEGEPSATAMQLYRIETSPNTLAGTTTTFGIPAYHKPEVRLTLQVERTDGTIVTKIIDVTDQVINSINPRDVLIIINGIEIPDGEIPDNPDGDVGIDVGVDGWESIEIEIGTVLPVV